MLGPGVAKAFLSSPAMPHRTASPNIHTLENRMLLVKGGCLVGQYLILNRVLFNQTLGGLTYASYTYTLDSQGQ